MPTFSTPEPITATVDLGVGYLRVTAEDRSDTQVLIEPTNPGSRHDIRAADETTVDFARGRLTVRAPRGKLLGLLSGSVTVNVTLPTGSRVVASAGVADIDSTGRLSDCRYKTGTGRVQLQSVDGVVVKSGSGGIRIDEIRTEGSLTTGSGDVHIGTVAGRVHVRNASGNNSFGDVRGSVTVKGASGDITADSLDGELNAKTASGSLRIEDAVGGTASLTTASGSIDVGIHEGTAAWLDAHAASGEVRNGLDTASGPEEATGTVRITARNYAGDIFIRRTHLVS
ncbi:DUF4097 family beta strand repeat-containing protein [Jongsikchunia kroppenstedtii]|uniref:DUF4097 family beta strand repeat-containing protein n=1 Tax=Jongsikchunia kroppenstedtii TaxID=1121721 RepID=UPI000475858B|nr:DUF4097 family beta strand repeat-containing protein [Jongsikchunia kroppenstedtii]